MERDYYHDFSDFEGTSKLKEFSRGRFGNATHLPVGIWVVSHAIEEPFWQDQIKVETRINASTLHTRVHKFEKLGMISRLEKERGEMRVLFEFVEGEMWDQVRLAFRSF